MTGYNQEAAQGPAVLWGCRLPYHTAGHLDFTPPRLCAHSVPALGKLLSPLTVP